METRRGKTGKSCNCQRNKRDKCPLRGECLQKNAIYHAKVTNGEEVRNYVGSTIDFKKRYYGHMASFRNEAQKHNTALSTHIWEKELGPEPNIEWSIITHAPAYSKGQRNCDLCLTEKLHIAKTLGNSQYLNRRTELAQRCRHRAQFLLQPPTRRGAEGQ